MKLPSLTLLKIFYKGAVMLALGIYAIHGLVRALSGADIDGLQVALHMVITAVVSAIVLPSLLNDIRVMELGDARQRRKNWPWF